jgi:hypothetical protein
MQGTLDGAFTDIVDGQLKAGFNDAGCSVEGGSGVCCGNLDFICKEDGFSR